MANGYGFTFNGGKVGLVKTGMLIVTSRPFDGQIKINGKVTKYNSGFYLLATKISGFLPGTYDIEIAKTGYRTWKNSMDITPGMVTWANYVLLFADKLNINKITVPTGTVVTQSQNGRHILYADKSLTSFSLKSLDTNNLAVKDFWPQAGVTDTWLVSPQIVSASFSTNDDRVLLSIQNADKLEYVIADGTGSLPKLIKLSTVWGKNFSEFWWSKANNSEVYLRDGNNVYLVGINDAVLPAPLATDIISLEISDSRQIYFVGKNASAIYYLGRMNLDGSQKEILEDTVAPSKSYKLGYSPQTFIVSVLDNDTKELDSFYIGTSVKKYSLKMSGNVLGFGWSKNGQKLFYWGSDFAKRYDWEKNKEIAANLTDTTLSLDWYFDENHYIVTSDKGIYVIDYDGTNKVAISDGASTTSDLDQGNNNIIYSFKAVDGTTTFYKYISEF